MKKVLLGPFIVLSAVGLISSIIVHVTALSGNPVPFDNLAWGLHGGIFIVMLPTVLVSMKLSKDFKRKDFWKAALRGCPQWMKIMTYFFFAYAIINFVIFFISTTVMAKGAAPSTATVFIGFSGHWMAFYSAAFAVLYSSTKSDLFDKERKCRNGHLVSPLAKFCEECGAQIIDKQL